MFQSIQEAKTAAQILRRELKALNKHPEALTHMDVLELLAKVAKSKGWNDYRPKLEALEVEARKAAQDAQPVTKVEIQDQVPRGVEGKLVTLDGCEIRGSYDKIPGCAGITSAHRNADGTLELEHDGKTDVWWDDQEYVHRKGEMMFVDENYEIVPASQVMVVPEGWTPDAEDEEDEEE